MTREHRHQIDIDATSDQVWRAISDGEELTRWFADSARVTPGEGGTVTVGWEAEDGANSEGTSVIDVWQPGSRLRLVDQPGPGLPEIEEPTIQEWTIEVVGGRTVLTLVHSGFPDTDDWDDIYDSTDHGWDIFFHNLQFYLERHPGKPRSAMVATSALGIDHTEAWKRLIDRFGVNKGRFTTTLPTGETLSGSIVMERPGKVLLASVDQLDEGLLFVTVEIGSLWASLAAYGDARQRLDGIAESWKSTMLDMIGA